MRKEDIIRVPTGIKGFDKLIEGGFPKGAGILLSGTPGTGKTLFGLEYLYNGASKYNDPGLLFTLADTRENIIKSTKKFKWDLQKLVNKKIFLEYMPTEDYLTVSQIMQKVDYYVKEKKIKRLVIDSLSTLIGMRNENQDAQSFIQDIFIKLMKYSELTKLLISEIVDEKFLSSDGKSEFYCEGIVKFIYRSMSGDYNSDILVRKMRYTKHINEIYPLEISSKGLVVHSS